MNELRETINALWDNAVSGRTMSAYQISNISVDEQYITQHKDPFSEVSEDVLCLYIAHCFKTLQLRYTTTCIKLYLCGKRFAYLRTGVPCPLIEFENSSVRILTLLNAVKHIQGQGIRPRHPN